LKYDIFILLKESCEIMLKSKKRLALLAALGLFLFPTVLVPANAKPNNSQANSASNTYDRAKQELSEDLYVVYRLVERIARANKLDESNWRVIISPEYELNAFATDVNLIAVYNGLLDRVSGDSSALACVISHEMAHHAKRHVALSPAQQAQKKLQFRQEAEAQVKQEIEDAQSDIEAQQIGSDAVSIFGGAVGNIIGGDAGIIIGSSSDFTSRYLKASAQEREQIAKERVEEIAKAKETELNLALQEESRTLEFEADEEGYKLMVKAGFEPEGCLRMMDILGRTEGAEIDSTHPAVPKRLEKIKEFMSKYPTQSLVNEGKNNMNLSSQPLSYEKSKDGISLRINSKFGGSTANDIDRVLDK
jgi:predicted Zn-dependent protease